MEFPFWMLHKTHSTNERGKITHPFRFNGETDIRVALLRFLFIKPTTCSRRGAALSNGSIKAQTPSVSHRASGKGNP